jgi:hypothetical protein
MGAVLRRPTYLCLLPDIHTAVLAAARHNVERHSSAGGPRHVTNPI